MKKLICHTHFQTNHSAAIYHHNNNLSPYNRTQISSLKHSNTPCQAPIRARQAIDKYNGQDWAILQGQVTLLDLPKKKVCASFIIDD